METEIRKLSDIERVRVENHKLKLLNHQLRKQVIETQYQLAETQWKMNGILLMQEREALTQEFSLNEKFNWDKLEFEQ